MKKKNIYDIILNVLLITLIIFLSLETFFLKKHLTDKEIIIDAQKDTINVSRNIINNGFLISKFYESINNQILETSGENGAKKLILLVVQKGECGICISRIIIDLIKLSDSLQEGANVVIVGDFFPDEFNTYINGINPFKYIHIKNISDKIVGIHDPFVFVIKNDVPSLLYVPESYPELNEKYFYDILPQFLKLVIP